MIMKKRTIPSISTLSMPMIIIAVLTVLFPLVCSEHIKVADLAQSFNEKHPQIDPTYTRHPRKSGSHDVHISDDFGNIYNISYQHKIPTHFNVLYLDKVPYETFECMKVDSDNFEITFRQPDVAKYYYDNITSHSYVHDNSIVISTHFIVTSPEHQCHNRSSLYLSSSLHEITDAFLSHHDATLVLTTSERHIFDLFETIEISLETNFISKPSVIHTEHKRRLNALFPSNWDDFEITLPSPDEIFTEFDISDVSDACKDVDPIEDFKEKGKRGISIFMRLGAITGRAVGAMEVCFDDAGVCASKAKDALVNGIAEGLEQIKAMWNGMKPVLSSVFDPEIRNKDLKGIQHLSFHYNYDSDEGTVCESELQLSHPFGHSYDITCLDCYLTTEFMYVWNMKKQENGKMAVFMFGVKGELEMQNQIKTNVKLPTPDNYTTNRWSHQTDKRDTGLKITVEGITLYIKLALDFGVGATLETPASFGMKLNGFVEAGINYQSAHKKNAHAFANHFDRHFELTPIGPEPDRDGVCTGDGVCSEYNIYTDATLMIIFDFLQKSDNDLTEIGHFFLTAVFNVDVTTAAGTSEAASSYGMLGCDKIHTITPTLTIASGATITVLGEELFTLKFPPPKHIPIPVDRSKVEDIDDFGSVCVVWPDFAKEHKIIELVNKEDGSSRRRILDKESKFKGISYDLSTLRKRWHPHFKWGQNFAMWRGNLSLLEESCPKEYEITSGATAKVILPDSAHIFVWAEENEGDYVTALYTVSKELKQSDGFAVDTNITCTFTYLLKRIDGVFPTKDRVERYHAVLFTTKNGSASDDSYSYCDRNMSFVYNDDHQLFVTFTLPPVMDVVFLDPSFGAIVMTDDYWLHCHSFILSRTQVAHFLGAHDDSLHLQYKSAIIDSLPYSLWKGQFHCEHKEYSDKIKMTIDYVLIEDGQSAEVYLTLIDISQNKYATGDGSINLSNMHLDVDVVGWFDTSVNNNNSWNLTWDWNIGNEVDEFKLIGFITIFESGYVLYSGVMNRSDGFNNNCTGFVLHSFVDVLSIENNILNVTNETVTEIVDDDDDDEMAFCIKKDEQVLYIVVAAVVVLILLTLAIVVCILCCKQMPKGDEAEDGRTSNHS
eukprot:171780_1